VRLEEEARTYFNQNFNCAQAVFAPFAKRLGLDLYLAFKLATPFGGGMCHMGQTCGAVIGGLMAIGLAKGIIQADTTSKAACNALAKDFLERFRSLHGDLTCPGLLGLDAEDLTDLERAMAEDASYDRCPIYVGDAARIVGEMLGLD